MACKFIREITCDCCGSVIQDLFGGYEAKKFGGFVYDICNSCMDTYIIPGMVEAEKLIVHKYFVNEEGRSDE